MRRILPSLLALWGCQPCPPLEPCWATRATCQQEIMDVVSCMRGVEVPLPEVRVVPPSVVVDEWSAEQDPDSAQREATMRVGLAKIGMSEVYAPPGGSVADFVDQVAAYYSRDEQRVTIIDRENSSTYQTEVLMHELVHAAQDAEGVFEALRMQEFTTDGSLAQRGITEGEATLFTIEAMLNSLGWAPHETNLHGSLQVIRDADRADARLSDYPVDYASLHFPYGYGMSFMYDEWLRSGAWLSDPAWRWNVVNRSISSTAEIMHFYEEWPEPSEELGSEAVALVPNAPIAGVTELGAWLMPVFCTRASVPEATCQGVTDDRFTGYRISAANTLAIWRLRTVSTDVARSLRTRLALLPDVPSILLDDRDVVAVWGPQATRDELLPTLMDLPWVSEDTAWDSLGDAARANQPRADAICRFPLLH